MGGHKDTVMSLRQGTGKAQGSCPRDTEASNWGPIRGGLRWLTGYPSSRYSRSPGVPVWRGQKGVHSTGGMRGGTERALGLQIGGLRRHCWEGAGAPDWEH